MSKEMERAETIEEGEQGRGAPSGPLAGVKVLDLSTLLPGPYATALLADLGAEVTRVESPSRPDLVRALPPFVDGQSAVHLGLNRGKRSIALDLKRVEGVGVARQLAERADVLVEQFRPGVMARLGLDYETLSKDNPSLIYCSITGYGQHGPLAQRAGHDINYLALAGVSSYSGRSGEGPRLSGTQVADLAGGAQPAVIAILAALFERQGTGLGRHLDISMSDGALALNALNISSTALSGDGPQCGDQLLNGGGLYDYYKTADHRYLAIGSLEPQFATRLFEGLESPELSREYGKPPGRQEGLRAALAELIQRRSLEEWINVFEPLDCCVSAVLTLDEALKHPHFAARGVLRSTVQESGAEVMYVCSPAAAAFQLPSRSSGPMIGAHTDELLAELGYTQAERGELYQSGVAYSV